MIHIPSPRPMTRREALCRMGGGIRHAELRQPDRRHVRTGGRQSCRELRG